MMFRIIFKLLFILMADQIQAMLTKLEEARKRLRGVWSEKKSKLDDTHDQQTFYRDADQLDALSNSQEV